MWNPMKHRQEHSQRELPILKTIRFLAFENYILPFYLLIDAIEFSRRQNIHVPSVKVYASNESCPGKSLIRSHDRLVQYVLSRFADWRHGRSTPYSSVYLSVFFVPACVFHVEILEPFDQTNNDVGVGTVRRYEHFGPVRRIFEGGR